MTPPATKLTWDVPKKVKANSSPVQMVITGTNKTGGPIHLSQLNFIFATAANGKGIFQSSDFTHATWVIGKLPASYKPNMYEIITKDIDPDVPVDDPLGILNVYVQSESNGTETVLLSASGNAMVAVDGVFTLAFVGQTGVAGTYPFKIVEKWVDDKENVTSSVPFEGQVVLAT